METQFTLGEILEKAIQKEIGSERLYTELSQKMQDQVAKEAFQELAGQEQGHRNLLQQYQRGELKGGTLGRKQVIDYKIAEHPYQPEVSPDMKLKDIFLLAANRERHSYELYLALAGLHPPGEAKKLLEELASQEMEHKQRVEFLYTEVAFPQTNGG
jgi:rubrerythrin